MAKFLRNELKKDCEMDDSKVDTPDNIGKMEYIITITTHKSSISDCC